MVQIRPAYEWTCDNCGRNNFVSAIVADFDESDRLQVAIDLGLLDPFETEVPEELTGDFVTYPYEVECSHCGSEYEVEYEPA